MKIKANRNSWDIIEGREYELLDQNECYCCVIDEGGEDNWYPKRYFHIDECK